MKGVVMSSLSYFLATRKCYRLLGVLIRLQLLWWAIWGRPIIYGVKFHSFYLSSDNRNVLIANNWVGDGKLRKKFKAKSII